jgi:oligoribonuclease
MSATPSTSPSATNLLWMDMEMSGLDPDQHAILEIATIVTDSALHVLAEGPVMAIHQPDALLDAMDDWNREHHGASGLTARVRSSPHSLADAEAATLAFAQRYCTPRTSPLCGNSVHHDRRFLVRYMPSLTAFLHYRIIDVSTVKELVQRWYPNGPAPPEKRHAHLALDDIRESIDELRFYRAHVFR